MMNGNEFKTRLLDILNNSNDELIEKEALIIGCTMLPGVKFLRGGEMHHLKDSGEVKVVENA